MIISRDYGRRLVRAGRAHEVGLTCTGARWPEGEHQVIIYRRDDPTRTDHYPATPGDEARLAIDVRHLDGWDYEVRVGRHVAYGRYDSTGLGGLDHAPTQEDMDSVGDAVMAIPADVWAAVLKTASVDAWPFRFKIRLSGTEFVEAKKRAR